MKETYEYVVEVPKKVVEKVKVMVEEAYPYVESFNTARMETAQAIRELPDQVTKKIDEITPKNGPLASKVGFNVGLAGVAMGAVAMVVSTFITPVETANAITQGLTNTAQNVGRYIEKAAQEPGLILQDGKKLVNASVEWMQNSSDYEKGKLTGQVAGEAGLLLVGAGEAKAGLKTAELAEAAAKVGLKAEAKIVTEKALLKESGIVGTRELQQAAVSQARQSYKVLMEPEVTGKIYNLRLTEDGKIRYFVNGERKSPKTTFDYVLQDGKLKFGEKHSFITNGKEVEYAGEMTLSDDGTKIVKWNDRSGHYKPSALDVVGQQNVMNAFKNQFGFDLPLFTPFE